MLTYINLKESFKTSFHVQQRRQSLDLRPLCPDRTATTHAHASVFEARRSNPASNLQMFLSGPLKDKQNL